MSAGTAAPRASLGRGGKLAVAAILLLGTAAATAKVLHERTVEPHVIERMEALRVELSALDAAPLLAEGGKGLRERLRAGGWYDEFIQYRDRAIPLLEEDHRGGTGSALQRTAWLSILLRIDSPRSLPFFRALVHQGSAASDLEPDLRREVDNFLARHGAKE